MTKLQLTALIMNSLCTETDRGKALDNLAQSRDGVGLEALRATPHSI